MTVFNWKLCNSRANDTYLKLKNIQQVQISVNI